MKKKLVVLILFVALVSSLLLSSCTFVKENEERVAASVVSTVSCEYEGNDSFPSQNLTLDITRTELLNYVNYIIYLYSQYQMDYEIDKVLDDGLESLRTQKYQMLKGMEYLMNNASAERKAAMYYFTDDYKNVYGSKITCEGLLTIAERYQAIADTNEQFDTSIDGYIDDYNTENRSLDISVVKETLTGLYYDGYTVKEEDGVSVAHLVNATAKTDAEKYADGLYQTQFSSDFDDVDYQEVYAKIILVKKDSDDIIVYYPITEGMMALADNADDTNNNPRLTNRTLTVTYQEPKTTTTTTKDDDGKDVTTTSKTYIAHAVDVEYTKFAPRNIIPKDSDGNDVVETIDYLDGTDYNYRYKTTFTTDAEKEFAGNGSIFDINPSNLTTATKDAYRQFKQAKKAQLIGFDATDTIYNGLGYFYLTSFQSSLTTAVKHELALSAYATNPVTEDNIEAQFTNLATKQKEEYALLSQKDQVAKFAKTIGTNLETCYYVPLDALKNTTYTYTDSADNEVEKAYAVENADGTYTIDMFYIAHILFKFDANFKTIMDRATANLTEDEDIKNKKLDLIETGLLDTNTTNPDYLDNLGEELKDAFSIMTDSEGNAILNDNGEQQLLYTKVIDVYNQLQLDLAAATTYEAKLDIFKEYMTKYNDDSGSLTSNIGYFIGMGDIEHSYDGDDFPNASKTIYTDFLEDGTIDTFTQRAFTSYGLHVEAISFMPLNNVTINNPKAGLYSLDINTNLDITGEKTIKDTIQASLISTQKDDAYSAWTDQYDKDEAEANSTLNKSVLKKIKKDLNID